MTTTYIPNKSSTTFADADLEARDFGEIPIGSLRAVMPPLHVRVFNKDGSEVIQSQRDKGLERIQQGK